MIHPLEAIFDSALLVSWNVLIEISCTLFVKLHCLRRYLWKEYKNAWLKSEYDSNQVERSCSEEDNKYRRNSDIVLVHVNSVADLVNYEFFCYVI
jgi:hypothetical protein